MLSPETMELERVSGVNTENPMHGYQIKSVHSDSRLIYAHLLAGGLGRWFARFIFVQNWLHKPPPVWTYTIARPFQVFHPHRCQKFHYVISSYIRSHPWATAVLEAEPCSQEASSISKFKISVWHSSLARSTGALPEDCWHPNWHRWISSIHTWTILIWSTCALPTLTSVCHSSHWLTGIQEESPLQMSKTRMNSEITCFNKNVLRWLWQRHVQNSGSCKSRVLWRWERDIKHPLKSEKSQYPLNRLNLTETEDIIRGQIELHGTAPLALAGENSSKRLQHRLCPPSFRRCLQIARLQRPLRKGGGVRLGIWRARGLPPLKLHNSSG